MPEAPTPPAAPASLPTETVTVESITAPLAERMPPITPGTNSTPAPGTESAPAAPAAPASVPAYTGPAVYDSRGIKFSPVRHQMDAGGNPIKNTKGNFILRPEYRKAHQIAGGTQAASPAPTGERGPATFGGASSTPGKESVTGPDEYDLQAEVYLQSGYGPLMLAFSPAVRPDAEQHAALKQSLAALLRKKQTKELDPAWAFGLTAVAVFVVKTQEPTVKERVVLYWLKVKGFFSRKAKTD